MKIWVLLRRVDPLDAGQLSVHLHQLDGQSAAAVAAAPAAAAVATTATAASTATAAAAADVREYRSAAAAAAGTTTTATAAAAAGRCEADNSSDPRRSAWHQEESRRDERQRCRERVGCALSRHYCVQVSGQFAITHCLS